MFSFAAFVVCMLYDTVLCFELFLNNVAQMLASVIYDGCNISLQPLSRIINEVFFQLNTVGRST